MNTIVPEGYKKTKVGVIPNDWQLYRTDKVLKRVRNSVDVIADEEYKQIGIRSHGKGIFYKESVSGKELGNKSVFWIEPDCFIVNIVFAWEQAIGKTTEKEVGLIASHRFPMYKPQANKVNLDYLVYLFKSKRGKYLLELASPGGAGRNKTLGQGEFSELEIPLPPFKEQQKIAQILAIYDVAIVKQEELIKEKEQLKKGLMQKLLSDEVRFDGFNDEWEEVRLGEIGNPFNGLSGKTGEDFGIGEATYITYKNIFNYSKIKLDIFEKVKISDDEKQNLVQFGDMFFTVSSETPQEVGMSSVLLDNVSNTYLNSFCFGYRLNNFNTLDPYFARFYFRSFQMRDKISRLAQGSTRFNLSKNEIMKLKVKLPSLQEQQKIAEVLSLVDDEINLLKNEFEELKLQKKALIQKLLTGQVRVKV
jgi:type I restriction enzyme S subunit